MSPWRIMPNRVRVTGCFQPLVWLLALAPVVAGAQGFAVVAWGENDSGQVNVPLYLTNAVAVAGGVDHSVALRTDGTVIAWGGNNLGQTNVPLEATNVTGLAAGYHHTLALRGDGTVIGWGSDGYGQITVPENLSNVTAIAAGPNTSLALLVDGTVVGWGQNQYGQTNGAAAGSNVTAIACGYHGLALKNDGTVTGWGFGFWGQTNGALAGNQVAAIAAGVNHSLALRSNGTVVAWGRNFEGQTNVPASLTNVTAIAAGLEQSMALRSNGLVRVWGRGVNGETNVPATLSNVVAIAAGVAHCLALTTDYPIYPRSVTNVVPVPRLRLSTTPGTGYELQYRDAVGSTNIWTVLDTFTPAVSPLTYYDHSAIGQTSRFYRLASLTEVSALQASMVPRLTLEVQMGSSVRLEYRNPAIQSTNWLFLDVVIATNSPQFYYDLSAIGQALRIYQLYETNAP